MVGWHRRGFKLFRTWKSRKRRPGQALAESDRVRACVARQWFRYSIGRSEVQDLDQCSLQSIDDVFADSNYDIKELLMAITQVPAFRYRTITTPGGGQ